MTDPTADPFDFYQRVLPGDFNRMLEAQRALGEAGRRVYEDMAAVNATIRIEITGDKAATFLLNIADGQMMSSEKPQHEPFVTLTQDAAAFRRLVRAVGGSVTGLLGALAGIGGNMKLTRKRVIELERVDGLIRFEVGGDDGFVVLTHFGTGARPAKPDASIRLSEEAYVNLRAGQLDPQDAFLSGEIDAEGNMEKVMQLAFAAVAPD